MASDAAVGSKSHAFLRHAKIISALTLLSRVFGLLRESVWAFYFGTGIVSSAFTIAFTVPNLFRKLFGEGALSAAFIPLYTKALKTRSAEEARDFATGSVNLLLMILLGITAAGELLLLWLIYSTSRPDLLLTLKFTAIMLPYVVLICGTAFLGAILQVHGRFAAPAFAPVLLNIVHIAVMVTAGSILGLGTIRGPAAEPLQLKLGYWLAGFVLVAGILQMLALMPSLRAVGFRFRPRGWVWNDAIRQMLLLSIPVALAAGVLQVSVLMDKGISAVLSLPPTGAAHFTLLGLTLPYPMELGAVKRLDWAQILYQFPLGVFAIALATAIFPGLSSEALEKDRDGFRRTFESGIEACLFEGIAASVGLIIVRYQAVQLLLKYGQVTGHDVELIARSLAIYASGIWAYSMQQIINRAYYALHDTRTPFLLSLANIALNLVVELPLLWMPLGDGTRLGESGMAAGTSISFAVQSLVMLFMLRRRIGGLRIGRIAWSAARMLLAAALMATACWLIQLTPLWPTPASDHGAGFRLAIGLQLVILIGVGAAVYLSSCHVMGVRTLTELLRRHRP
jgi:putative peptidoglycan lipid II flippase